MPPLFASRRPVPLAGSIAAGARNRTQEAKGRGERSLVVNTLAIASLYHRQVKHALSRPILLSGFLLAAALLLTLPLALSPVRGQMPGDDVPASALQTATPSPTPAPPTAVPTPFVATVRIGPYNDASVDSGGRWTPDTNLGGWSELAVGAQDGGVFRSYLRFDLDGLPPGVQIDSARLLLTPVQTGARTLPVVASVVQEDWDEGTITWNQQPLTTLQAGAATWRPGQTSSPFAIDVTEAARTWYACGPDSNHGLQIAADGSSDWVVFGSRKSDAPPALEVSYEATIAPVPCTAAPASSGGSQGVSQPAPSTTGAQIGSVNPNAPVPTSPTPCPTGACATPTRTPQPAEAPAATSTAGAGSSQSSTPSGSGAATATATGTPRPTASPTGTPAPSATAAPTSAPRPAAATAGAGSPGVPLDGG